MIDTSTISVFFVMFMVIVVLLALGLLGSEHKKKYFWPLFSFASLFGVVALILVLIK